MKILFNVLIILLCFYKLEAQSSPVDPSIETAQNVMDDSMKQQPVVFIYRVSEKPFHFSWTEQFPDNNDPEIYWS